MTAATRGIILFAHGSRDPLWHKPMEAVAEQLRAGDGQPQVSCAYLELSTPDLPLAALHMIGSGVENITILPLFLGVGKHAREDLPALVEALRNRHPEVDFSLKAAVGEHPRLIQLLAEIALEIDIQ